jgi:hypothetical protein
MVAVPVPLGESDLALLGLLVVLSMMEPLPVSHLVLPLMLFVTVLVEAEPSPTVTQLPKASTDPDVLGAARAVPLARNQVAMMATDTAASRKANLADAFSEGPTNLSLVFINPHLLVR